MRCLLLSLLLNDMLSMIEQHNYQATFMLELSEKNAGVEVVEQGGLASTYVLCPHSVKVGFQMKRLIEKLQSSV